jgi:hypothetical protein
MRRMLNGVRYGVQRMHFHFGLVNHAFCAALRTMLKE